MMKLYAPGQSLTENEYLLKIRGEISEEFAPSGFLTKLTAKGELPKSFAEWGWYRYSGQPNPVLPIYVVEEVFRSGWKLSGWRIGKSQEWAEMIHPDGYTVEIYLTNFLTLVKNGEIVNGELIGKFKWQDKKLIKANEE